MLSLVLFCPIPPCNQNLVTNKDLVTLLALIVLTAATVLLPVLPVLTVTVVALLLALKPLGFPEGRSDQ
jgi:hypothetical protein